MSDSVDKLRAQGAKLLERAAGYKMAGDYQLHAAAFRAGTSIKFAANMLEIFEKAENGAADAAQAPE